MRWYLNDASLQSQFVDLSHFERTLRELLQARSQVPAIQQNLRSTRSLQEALAGPGVSVRQALQRCRDRELRLATFYWLDRTGPFVDDDRMEDEDDYFEFSNADVTDTGLGEAARRTKAGENCAAYSFEGGAIDHALNPLEVDHGLPEERLGRYSVRNHWSPDRLVRDALDSGPQVTTWQALVETARTSFPHLEVADLHENRMLAREPFEASLRDRAMVLMGILEKYMIGRSVDGSEGPGSRDIIDEYFTGERALFSSESASNKREFRHDMTFIDQDQREVFAPWHGKISRRAFRLHFEWPLAAESRKLSVLYLGPKITKD